MFHSFDAAFSESKCLYLSLRGEALVIQEFFDVSVCSVCRLALASPSLANQRSLRRVCLHAHRVNRAELCSLAVMEHRHWGKQSEDPL